MAQLWKWIKRVTWLSAIIVFIVSAGWLKMDDFIALWNNLTPGKFVDYLIAIIKITLGF